MHDRLYRQAEPSPEQFDWHTHSLCACVERHAHIQYGTCVGVSEQFWVSALASHLGWDSFYCYCSPLSLAGLPASRSLVAAPPISPQECCKDRYVPLGTQLRILGCYGGYFTHWAAFSTLASSSFSFFFKGSSFGFFFSLFFFSGLLVFCSSPYYSPLSVSFVFSFLFTVWFLEDIEAGSVFFLLGLQQVFAAMGFPPRASLAALCESWLLCFSFGPSKGIYEFLCDLLFLHCLVSCVWLNFHVFATSPNLLPFWSLTLNGQKASLSLFTPTI